MDNIILDLGAISGSINVQIVRKNIKNVHLKVFRDLRVVVSVPSTVSDDWLTVFLQSHVKWIEGQVAKYKKSSGYNTLSNIRGGTSTQLLGKDVRIYKVASLTNRIELEEKRICLYMTNPEDEQLAQNLFNAWWRDTAIQLYTSEMQSLHRKIFIKHNVKEPSIVVRKMNTLWGSCSPARNKITLNEYLLKADLRCIQYVILHELAHLIYPNHSKQFYNFLTIYMPDWEERKKQLDNEVVQGL
ncbi:MAG: DUF45 domain-containing protein [Eubacterium sp.]|nr:DUF45 domain-containing protein [Eubacterium sp.]